MLSQKTIVLSDLEDCPVDMSEIIGKATKFYILITHLEEDSAIDTLISCRGILNVTMVLVRNLLDSQYNKYVREEEEVYQSLWENIGRADKRLDSLENTCIDRFNRQKDVDFLEEVNRGSVLKDPQLGLYFKLLVEYMELII